MSCFSIFLGTMCKERKLLLCSGHVDDHGHVWFWPVWKYIICYKTEIMTIFWPAVTLTENNFAVKRLSRQWQVIELNDITYSQRFWQLSDFVMAMTLSRHAQTNKSITSIMMVMVRLYKWWWPVAGRTKHVEELWNLVDWDFKMILEHRGWKWWEVSNLSYL